MSQGLCDMTGQAMVASYLHGPESVVFSWAKPGGLGQAWGQVGSLRFLRSGSQFSESAVQAGFPLLLYSGRGL